MTISKVVITAAGLGTRLLTVTKEQPKEMLPLFAKNDDDTICVNPLLQMIFEQLHDHGFRDFCFVIGRGKRVIEDHFTLDRQFIKQLKSKGKNIQASSLSSFYRKIEASKILWVNQPEPRGFGHAVLMAKPFIDNNPFLLHAGDTYIISPNRDHLARSIQAHKKYEAHATLLLKNVKNPKQHGIAEVEQVDNEILNVKNVIEKPDKSPTNLAIMPIYVFNPVIIPVMEKTPAGYGGEIQLTDGIQTLVKDGFTVQALKLREDEIRLDVGTPETYWKALTFSHKYLSDVKSK